MAPKKVIIIINSSQYAIIKPVRYPLNSCTLLFQIANSPLQKGALDHPFSFSIKETQVEKTTIFFLFSISFLLFPNGIFMQLKAIFLYSNNPAFYILISFHFALHFPREFHVNYYQLKYWSTQKKKCSK